jgi:hypothetical protein
VFTFPTRRCYGDANFSKSTAVGQSAPYVSPTREGHRTYEVVVEGLVAVATHVAYKHSSRRRSLRVPRRVCMCADGQASC